MNKMIEMYEMQDDLNSRLDADWKNRDWDWFRAIWIECAEAMEQVPGGYKWWKKSNGDVAKLQMELVDIWHFILSAYIRSGIRRVTWKEDFDRAYCFKSPCSAIDDLARQALNKDVHNVLFSFMSACKLFNLTYNRLYELYAGKYTLNHFRWDNGYIDGTYRKAWSDGREDNDHLNDIIALCTGSDEFVVDVYDGLAKAYAA
jgi:dimeric dUTPase (all-alpha-NTP-PPase superfamily)